MGSAVVTSSNAVDNRMALTGNALGINNYGGKTAYAAPIFDFSSHVTGGGKKTSTIGGGVSGVSINMLDGGAINKSFDFAAFSLSEVLSHLIDSQKSQQDATQYTADSIASAMQQAATTQGAALAATKAAEAEIAKENQTWLEQFGVKTAWIVGAGLAVWYVWGRK